jgi:hypothetical protein
MVSTKTLGQKIKNLLFAEAGGAPGFFGRRLQQGTSAKP